MKAFITVMGHDTVGVVAKVSGLCSELNINIEDVPIFSLSHYKCNQGIWRDTDFTVFLLIHLVPPFLSESSALPGEAVLLHSAA